MNGNSETRIVLQDRDRRLLSELAIMRVFDRELAKKVAGFRTTRRANKRLLQLRNAGLLRRFFQGTEAGGKKALYTLSSRGARLIGVLNSAPRHGNDELMVSNFFIAHQMALNEMYCAVRFGAMAERIIRWLSFSRPLAHAIPLVPDGYFEIATEQGTLAAFLEIDLGGEREAVWHSKVRNYLQYAASGEFQERFGQSRFRVLIIAISEPRLQTIRRYVSKLTDKVFWLATFPAIRRGGMCDSVWVRPLEKALRPLF